ncbi:helix-turn-helix domain-containing protein [Paenibacillus thalictri]|uniref:helix-turn-helix domain-containing protein n=1 Tax=Paenibacillus thalictri TaxID=2527873 RepID=UPI0013EF320F|nr:helix-turn-helix domain-containing protein [Paenibacillus thalictri]
MLTITCIPTALIGVGSYYIGSSYIEREVHRTHQLQLGKGMERLSETFSQLEMNLTQWTLNPSFDVKLKNLDFVNQYAEIQDMYKSIMSMKVSNPLIDKIYLYLDGPQALITDELARRNMSEQEKRDFRSLIGQTRDMFWLRPESELSLNQGKSKVMLVHNLAAQAIKPYGALLVYLSPERVNVFIGELTTDDFGTSFLLDENKQMIGSADPAAGNASLQNALWKEMQLHNQPDGSFDWTWDGRTYSISYGTIHRLGQPWTFVSATTLSNLTAPVLLISRLMIGISAFSLLLALLLSWFASNKLYRPIQRMVQLAGANTPDSIGSGDELELVERRWRHITRESEELQHRLDRAKPMLKEGFLLQFVQGHLQSLSEEETFEQMKSFGWRPEGCGYQLLLIQLRGLSPLLQDRFLPGDEPLITFAAANIAEEVVGQKYEHFGVINFRDLSVGVLIPLSPAGELQHHRDTYQLAQDMLGALHQTLKLQITVSIAKFAPAASEVATAFEQAKQALSYRRVDHDNEILAAWELLPIGEEPVFYPFELEKTIIQTIRVGRMEEAMALIETFYGELQRHTAKEGPVQQGMQQLLGAMLHLVMQTGFHPHKLYDGMNVYELFARLKEPGDILPWFQNKIVAPYISALTEAQDFYMKRLVAQVAETIHQQYMNEISLEYCADLFGTSTVKLSSAFKQIMGVNFIDYLTQVRMDKVKQLLIGTDMKINDISLAVGYQPTYFNRIFKKQEGITASEFRERSRVPAP